MALPIVIDDGGVVRLLGNVEGPLKFAWTVYGDVPRAPMVPRARWRDVIAAGGNDLDHPHLPPVADQSSIGMCNCSATCSAIEGTRLPRGLPYVQLSGGDLYKRIAVGGQDNGSLLEDGIREAMANGVASVGVVPYLDWRKSHPAAGADRKRFRVLEAFLCPTFDHCMSAVLMGFKLVSGVRWWTNFTVDSEGWLPARGAGNYGGHAIMGYKGVERGGVFGIAHQNSWTSRWGVGGRFAIPESLFDGGVGGCWAVAEVVAEAGDVPAPKG